MVVVGVVVVVVVVVVVGVVGVVVVVTVIVAFVVLGSILRFKELYYRLISRVYKLNGSYYYKH